MRKVFFPACTCALVVLLAGCASPDMSDDFRLGTTDGDPYLIEAKKAHDEGRNVIICKKTQVTGTHAEQTRCVPYMTYLEERRLSKKAFNEMQLYRCVGRGLAGRGSRMC